MSNKSRPAPPTSRRSARQQRLASREANRQLARAGTRGSGGAFDLGGILLWTVLAGVVGIVIIGGAFVLTQTPSATSLPSPMAPVKTTPPDIASSGQVLGDPNAPATVDVYSDFRCTGCFAFAMEIEPNIVKDYVATGKAKLVYHDYVIIDHLTGGTESRDAANAALCAADQGKFWLFHDWLFTNQSAQEKNGYMTIDRLLYMGKAAGLNMATFEPCVRQGSHLDQVAAEESAAPSGVSSTPTIFVNGTKVENPNGANYIPTYDDIKAAIEGVLNPSASASPSASAEASSSASPEPTASAS
jgi:protein-disulfide isomerase